MKQHQTGLHYTGFTAGSFDLLHEGHVAMLQEAKERCDYLIVFLQTDPSIDRPEKNKPIMSIGARLQMLRSIRYVDEVWQYSTEERLQYMIKELIDTGRSLVRIIGADWKGKDFTGKILCEQNGVAIYYNSRDHGMSTTVRRREVFEAELLKYLDEEDVG